VEKVIGSEAAKVFCDYYDITGSGNFEGSNIPNLIESEISDKDLELLNKCREMLFNHREKRVHPYKDDKILTAWNGLMIAALAIGGKVFRSSGYTSATEQAVEFIYKKLIRNDGRLLARNRDGEAAFPAYVDDYAFLIWGLIELYETTFKPEYLLKAVELNKEMLRLFWDDKNGGLFIYGEDGEKLIMRPKEIYDGATPSGNSVAALNLLRLARLTGEASLEDKANELLRSFSRNIKAYPRGYSFSLVSLLFSITPSQEVVIAADSKSEDLQIMLDTIRSGFRPFTVTMLYSGDTGNVKKVAPFVADYRTVDGKVTAYVCKNFACQAPVTNIEELMQKITEVTSARPILAR
jgi:uncharacterized protein YyaL (SSP411 family)